MQRMVMAMMMVALVAGCGQGEVRVTELEKDRTHTFALIADGTRFHLQGHFSIEGELYPGELLYDGEQSSIYRPDPDQCIIYASPSKELFGFLPVGEEVPPDIEVLEWDSKGRAITYRVGDRSLVEIKNLDAAYAQAAAWEFALPGECINEEEVFTVG